VAQLTHEAPATVVLGEAILSLIFDDGETLFDHKVFKESA
tara:strand:- start:76 stop:195 length:120 start_codon:yes stop_codon:yes gene_type:complete